MAGMPSTSKLSLIVTGSPSRGRAVPAFQCRSEIGGCLACALPVKRNDGIELRVDGVDPIEGHLDQFRRGQFPAPHPGQQHRGGLRQQFLVHDAAALGSSDWASAAWAEQRQRFARQKQPWIDRALFMRLEPDEHDQEPVDDNSRIARRATRRASR